MLARERSGRRRKRRSRPAPGAMAKGGASTGARIQPEEEIPRLKRICALVGEGAATVKDSLELRDRTGVSISDVEIPEQLLGGTESLPPPLVQLLHGSWRSWHFGVWTENGSRFSSATLQQQQANCIGYGQAHCLRVLPWRGPWYRCRSGHARRCLCSIGQSPRCVAILCGYGCRPVNELTAVRRATMYH